MRLDMTEKIDKYRVDHAYSCIYEYSEEHDCYTYATTIFDNETSTEAIRRYEAWKELQQEDYEAWVDEAWKLDD